MTVATCDRNGMPRPSVSAVLNLDGVWQETVSVNGCPLSLIWVPPGEFWMGATEDDDHWLAAGGYAPSRYGKPRHRVRITRGLWLGKVPVTQRQWEAASGPCEKPSWFDDGGEEAPVENVSWMQCQAFVRKLERWAGGGWRLPTEAEWEFACRAGSEAIWCFGNDEQMLKEYGWCRENSDRRTHSVGLLKPNEWGLYDMHGNVREWVADWFGDYPDGDQIDPTGPPSGTLRCARGGDWDHDALSCGSATRLPDEPGSLGHDSSYRYRYVGLRLARSSGNADAA